MIRKEELKKKLEKVFRLSDIAVECDNEVRDNTCLVKEKIEDAEKCLRKRGFTMVGVCYDIPTSLNLGLHDCCLLIVEDVKTGKLHWLHCFKCVINMWLEVSEEIEDELF